MGHVFTDQEEEVSLGGLSLLVRPLAMIIFVFFECCGIIVA
jgi:hypothetical protein